MANPAELLQWGPWQRLTSAARDREIPPAPGLYRIRRIGHDDLDYIDQTGMGTMTLRKRLAAASSARRPGNAHIERSLLIELPYRHRFVLISS